LALTPGTRLGVYEIVAQIGEGGMGQVFRATDTKLKRQVAIKILPPSFASDPDRLARFTREAQTLASLNHPNIAAIYGLEESGGMTALVMELVEGDDLSQRIVRGAIPIDEALPIAKQIAEALEAAHEQGIIHRDLKPANMKVRSDGMVKVLDFGLAKAMEPTGAMSPSLSQAPTLTSPALVTGAGMILGTAAYMSPEQARGKAVDKRADIWAFGAVLYEMLTGVRAFPGEDVTDTLAVVDALQALRGANIWVGDAYVFVRTGATWTEQAFIKASNARPYNSFGVRLTLSADGNTLAVSAYLQHHAGRGIRPSTPSGDWATAGTGSSAVRPAAATTLPSLANRLRYQRPASSPGDAATRLGTVRPWSRRSRSCPWLTRC
jgi:serine/threonine protein kinase